MIARWIVLLPVALAACSIQPPPPDRFFRIETPTPPTAAAASFHVQVTSIEAAGLYTERPLVFEREGNGGALEQYHYYFWTEPPDLLLVDALVHYLRGALGTGQVFGPGGGGTETDFVVRAKLRKLDQRLGDNAASAVLAIQFTIEDEHRKVLGVIDFEESAPAGNGAPAEHVKAIDDLAARAFAQLAARLGTMTPPK